jgi:3-phosphoglycerate kinase
MVSGMQNGEVLVLENMRFHAGEEGNDAAFSKELAVLGDVYVNDAFGAAHRAHASTAGIAAFVPQAAMGLLMEKELQYLQGELRDPARPFVVILGGSKVSDKIGVIKALMEKANTFLIGGAMAYTFFRAMGIPTGKSRVEADKVDLAKEILALAESKGVRFLLPVDNMETQEISATAQPRPTGLVSPAKGISEDWEAVDIGPETIARYCAEIAGAKTVLWNGPVGIFELEPFANGTKAIAAALASSSAVTIIGGGDSVTAVKQFGYGDKVSFCSTGGGASLELLEGKVLPGVAALSEKI